MNTATRLAKLNAFVARFEAGLTAAERPVWFALSKTGRQAIIFAAFAAGEAGL